MTYIDQPILTENEYKVLKANYDNYSKKNSLLLGEFIETLKASRRAIEDGVCEPTKERVISEYTEIINYLSRLEIKLSSHIVQPSRYIVSSKDDIVVPHKRADTTQVSSSSINNDTYPPYNDGSPTSKARKTILPNNGSILSRLVGIVRR